MSFEKLVEWSKGNYGHLPWRVRRSFYHTLVSEIMLQQTTVSTVVGKFDTFISKFPNLKTLAAASEEEVLIAWKGLGYYRRARNLKKSAESLASLSNIPENVEELKLNKGIGDYTANALLAIGMNKKSLAIDANVERVLARLLGLQIEKGPKLHREIKKQFEKGFLDKEFRELGPREMHEAIMDLGRTNCQLRKIYCSTCYLKQNCMAYKNKQQLTTPLIPLKKSNDENLDLLRIVVRKNKKILVYKKPKNTWLADQYELPTFILNATDKKLKQYPRWKLGKIQNKMVQYKSGITKYKITNNVIVMNLNEFESSFPRATGLMWKEINSDKENFAVSVNKSLAVLND